MSVRPERTRVPGHTGRSPRKLPISAATRSMSVPFVGMPTEIRIAPRARAETFGEAVERESMVVGVVETALARRGGKSECSLRGGGVAEAPAADRYALHPGQRLDLLLRYHVTRSITHAQCDGAAPRVARIRTVQPHERRAAGVPETAETREQTRREAARMRRDGRHAEILGAGRPPEVTARCGCCAECVTAARARTPSLCAQRASRYPRFQTVRM